MEQTLQLLMAPDKPGTSGGGVIDIKPEELKAYNDELQKIIQPRRQSALDLYKQAVKKSYELEMYNDSTAEAYMALSRYLPAEYKPGRDFLVNDLKLGTLGL